MAARIAVALLVGLCGFTNAKSNFTERCPAGSSYCSYEGSPDNLLLAFVGDPGAARWYDLGNPTKDCAKLAMSWEPDFILSPGDNSYFFGRPADMDESMANYATYIKYPAGCNVTNCDQGSPIQRYWTAVGNHEWREAASNGTLGNCLPKTHLDYFSEYPGNKRYYTVRMGCPDATENNCLLELFVLSFNRTGNGGAWCYEPDGNQNTSVQAQWFTSAFSASTATWKIIMDHVAPYSSAPTNHPSNPEILSWRSLVAGADLHLAGDDHNYERFMNRMWGMPIIINGMSGFVTPQVKQFFQNPSKGGSVVQWDFDFVVTKLVIAKTTLTVETWSREGIQVDGLRITKGTGGAPNQWTELMDRQAFIRKWGFPSTGKQIYLADDAGQIGWHPGTYSQRTYDIGSQLNLLWNDGVSDFWRLASEAAYNNCDFTGGQMIVKSGFDPVTGVWGANNAFSANNLNPAAAWTNGWWFPLNKVGKWWIASTSGCSAGQKFILVVEDPSKSVSGGGAGSAGSGASSYSVVFNNN